ncbi:uracil phosphoribosyltransferase-domain-containing protein [Paraphoma chrysanthemicola]|uniref:Uracil phosphoribosyltransferase-domain-containing protein n=1 Tax=Paraphoma chrysanthemicola TaxID=798071 RepID=A0A8K0RI36_9PLEO|nr:uracil phosphoribosyltransferase-domain-containing protein [Paraphoma chrysanthemicola]
MDTTTIPSSSKPTIIGLYGVSGSGKTHLLNQVKVSTGFRDSRFAFYDGSELINQVVPGGLDGLKQINCRERNETAVIAGHYMFWDTSRSPKEVVVGIDKDWETYTHMIYLNTYRERTELRRICHDRGILFTTVNENASSVGNVTTMKLARLLQDFHEHTETTNERTVLHALDLALGDQEPLDKIILLDADRTLAPQDTGAMFWNEMAAQTDFADNPLRKLFTRHGYSYTSFRQATLLYESVAAVFDTVCEYVADRVVLYPEMQKLLARAAHESHTRAIVGTCGLSKVWKKVLRRYGLAHVQVIGGGRVDDWYVVTRTTKGNIVDELHAKKLRVYAFGDSPLDMAMLSKAYHAYIIVGAAETRSTSMDAVLETAISKGLQAKQILLPPTTLPRLTLSLLPQYDLTQNNLNQIFHRPFIHVISRPARHILQTPTRDATLAGPALRKAHEDIGKISAHTLIVPLMRGGEPMAFGISSVLPHASFAHARAYTDLRAGVLRVKSTLILVDSVINSGTSIVEFLTPCRRDWPLVRVVVVAGVVQVDAVRATDLGRMLARDARLSVVALRVSENRYVGKGVTDTGDRLFGTTDVEE